MKILDRYVLIAFIKNYLISLMVLLGLYVVLDMVFNFDELAEVKQKSQLVARVSDVTLTDGSIRATLTMDRQDPPDVGTEFKIAGLDGKTIARLTVDQQDGRTVSGPLKLEREALPQKGYMATAPSPAGSSFSVMRSIAGYYYHQSFLFFVQLSGVIPVVAAAFTLIRMSRFNELTAILAAGVPLLRVGMPIIYAGVVINFLLLPATQELVIPNIIPQLTKQRDELAASGVKSFPVSAMQDDSGALLQVGMYTPPDGNKPAGMQVVDIIERDAEYQVIGHIKADAAVYDPSVGGWSLINGQRVTGLGPNERRSEPEPVAIWKTSVTPEEISLYRSSDYVELLSTERINQLIQSGSYGMNSLLKVKHFRWSQLLVNIVLLLLAIPCVLTREPGTLKTDVTKCVLLTGLCMASIFLAHQVAGNPPSEQWRHQWPLVMAWLPIFLFLPLAIFLLDQKHAKKT